MTSDFPAELTEQMRRRIDSEFLEMPGLRLTQRQAQRLCGLDEQSCARSLEYLVDAGFLVRTGLGTYGRLTEGAAPFPRLRRAKGGPDQVDRRRRAPAS